MSMKKDSEKRAFHPNASHIWYVQDVMAFFITTLALPILFRNIELKNDLWHAIFIALGTLFIGLLQMRLYCEDKALYRRNRFVLTAFIRMGMAFLIAALSITYEAPNPTPSVVLMTLLLKSPVTHLAFTALYHRLEFRNHILIQTTMLLFWARYWIPPFCRCCSGDPAIQEMFQQIGSGIDSIFSFVLPNGPVALGIYPCWMISSFVFIVLGLIVPTFLIFIAEIGTRKAFLLTTLSRNFHCDIFHYANEAIRVAVLASLSSILASWLCLLVARDLFYAQMSPFTPITAN